MGPAARGARLSEEAQPPARRLPGMAYAYAKMRAEELCRKASANGRDVVVVNPAETYGPGDDRLVTAGNLVGLLQPPLTVVCRGGTCIAHVDDVAEGIVAALEKGHSGERYILGGENLDHTELARLTLAIAGPHTTGRHRSEHLVSIGNPGGGGARNRPALRPQYRPLRDSLLVCRQLQSETRARGSVPSGAGNPPADGCLAQTGGLRPVSEPIAIVGMGCRFAASRDLTAYWRTVREGEVCFGDVPDDRWSLETFHRSNRRSANHTYARAFGSVGEILSFAPEVFGISPSRARQMDPQQRLSLEVTRCALEDAGYTAGCPNPERTGVFLGVSTCEHRDYITARLRLMQMLGGDFGEAAELGSEAEGLVSSVPPVQPSALTGQMLNMAAANVAQAFHFRGPAYTVDSACSSALVAVYNAMMHLRAGQCDTAVAGGVYLNLTPDNFIGFSRIGALSKSGACRPFDAAADGFVLGEGAGTLVLRRLGDAVRDGDSVWAVLRGAGMSNDGGAGGPLAPSVEGQVAAMEEAYIDAEITPASVGFVEIHGTGTPVGDRAEAAAIERAMGAAGVECFLSSAKANVGHTLAAAGAASLIRAVLATAYGVRPPHAAFTRLSDQIRLEGSRFRVSPHRNDWPSHGAPRRAGVSAFGFGGTNVHIALEAAPESRRRPLGQASRAAAPEAVWLTIGAPSRELLGRHLLEIRDALDEADGVSLTCIARTLDKRSPKKVRVGLLAANVSQLRERLPIASKLLQGNELVASSVPWLREVPPNQRKTPQPQVPTPLFPLPPSPITERTFWALAEGSRRRHVSEALAVQNRVAVVVAEVAGIGPDRLSRESRLNADVGLDSLARIELAEALAKEFPGLEASSDSLGAADLTIGELANLITLQAGGDAPSFAQSRKAVQCTIAMPCNDPRLAEHCIDGIPTLPLAAALDIALSATGGRALYSWKASRPIQAHGESLSVKVVCGPSEVRLSSGGEGSPPCASGRVERTSEPPDPLPAFEASEPPRLLLEDFYQDHLFHGPTLRAILGVGQIGARHVIGEVRCGNGSLAGESLDWLALDGAMQLCAYWARCRRDRAALPSGFDALYVRAPLPWPAPLRCVAKLADASENSFTGDIDLLSRDGTPVLQIRGIRGRLSDDWSVGGDRTRIEAWPELVALRERFEAAFRQGLSDPYFRVREGLPGATKRIAGRSYIDFTSYNYLGLADDPDIVRAACEAVERYGTSASASRLASGEIPLHRELEGAIAEFLGCEAALVMVSGHATNVGVIGRLLGPKDLVVHDALIHDSISGGIRQAGARRRSFPHNDLRGLERVLSENRTKAHRALVAVEGVYSMDGDLVPLDDVVRIARRHGALTYVDEAHSIGVVGETGRGVGERFGVDRRAVDLWMGTLSKSLASCGGFVAGSERAIEYLRYTTPGFIYSVGLSPADTAAALAALRKLEREPERVAALQRNARRFLELCRERGVPVGSSAGSAVVPCIVGGSFDALRLSQALFERGIHAQPIVPPAVDEGQARLRFFLSSRHSEEQLLRTADVLADELGRLSAPKRPAASDRPAPSRRRAN